jgi:hypothetical protein
MPLTHTKANRILPLFCGNKKPEMRPVAEAAAQCGENLWNSLAEETQSGSGARLYRSSGIPRIRHGPFL